MTPLIGFEIIIKTQTELSGYNSTIERECISQPLLVLSSDYEFSLGREADGESGLFFSNFFQHSENRLKKQLVCNFKGTDSILLFLDRIYRILRIFRLRHEAFGRKPQYPDDPVDPVQMNFYR